MNIARNGKYRINKVKIKLKQFPFYIYEAISNKKVWKLVKSCKIYTLHLQLSSISLTNDSVIDF